MERCPRDRSRSAGRRPGPVLASRRARCSVAPARPTQTSSGLPCTVHLVGLQHGRSAPQSGRRSI
eukprot:6165731-Alexandrium_andersonii.AAC.1